MSDPSVTSMTEAQWRFEFDGLRTRERDRWRDLGEVVALTLKTGGRILRDTIIGVFGFNLFAKRTSAANDDDGPPPFVPGVYLLGNPRTIYEYEQIAKREQAGEAAAADAAFDKFSDDLHKRLKAGEIGDLEPIDGADLYWHSEEIAEDMARIGIVPRDPDEGPVPHFAGPKRGSLEVFDVEAEDEVAARAAREARGE